MQMSLQQSGPSANPVAEIRPGLQLSKKDHDGLYTFVYSEYQKMRAARSRTVQQWNLNLAFYYGRQYLEYSPVIGGKMQIPKAPPHRVRLVVNRIRPIIRTEVSKLTAQKPSASVIPATNEDEDLAAAYAAEQIWESISRNSNLFREFRQSTWWRSITGVGFIKTWWDPSIGPTSDITGQPMGDITFGNVTPYHLFVPDLRCVNLEEQPYVVHAYTRTPDAIRHIYGDLVKDINLTPNIVASNEILEDAVLNLAGGRTTNDSILCFEAWIKPGAHKLFPNGGMVTVVGSNVVYASMDGLPYKHGMYPFTKFEHIETGKFYTESTITDLMALQREYNRTRSQITEAKNRMAKPQLLVQKGSIIPSKVTTEPGLQIEYMPGFQPPTPLPLQPLPNYVLQEQDRIITDMEDISGQHQVSRGEAPAGVTAATAISFLQEKDDSILSTAFASTETGMEDIASKTLKLVVQYWDVARTIKTTGQNGAFDVALLTGMDLRNNTDIRMEGGSSLPTSKAAKQAFIMDMMKMGFVPPDKGLQLLEMGGVSKLNEEIRVDQSQAQRENIKLKLADPAAVQQFQQAQQQMLQTQMQAAQMGSGPPPAVDPHTGQPSMESILPVNNWDNHDVHIQIHNDYRKTQAFETLDDSIKAEFEAHVNLHIAAVNDAMAQIQQQQMMGGGMPPGPPGAPPMPPPNSQGGPPNGAV